MTTQEMQQKERQPYHASITRRKRIASLIRKGMSVKQVAEALKCSQTNVRHHLYFLVRYHGLVVKPKPRQISVPKFKRILDAILFLCRKEKTKQAKQARIKAKPILSAIIRFCRIEQARVKARDANATMDAIVSKHRQVIGNALASKPRGTKRVIAKLCVAKGIIIHQCEFYRFIGVHQRDRKRCCSNKKAVAIINATYEALNLPDAIICDESPSNEAN